VIYVAVFSYLADVYGPFASSALAGQSLARNLAGTAFPLFVTRLFGAVGYPWGNTLFALLALLLAPVPYVSPCTLVGSEEANDPVGIGTVLLWPKA
jgi:hypothetical protein